MNLKNKLNLIPNVGFYGDGESLLAVRDDIIVLQETTKRRYSIINDQIITCRFLSESKN